MVVRLSDGLRAARRAVRPRCGFPIHCATGVSPCAARLTALRPWAIDGLLTAWPGNQAMPVRPIRPYGFLRRRRAAFLRRRRMGFLRPQRAAQPRGGHPPCGPATARVPPCFDSRTTDKRSDVEKFANWPVGAEALTQPEMQGGYDDPQTAKTASNFSTQKEAA